MADKARVTKDITTGIGTLCFPHLDGTAKNDKGETTYDIQILIPKTQRDDLRALLAAVKEVGLAKWGDNWKKVRQPLRDGDREAGDIGDDGISRGEKYPERLGCYFINARSTKPVGVYNRKREVITEMSDVYGGCKGKINITFYPYASNGNTGIGAALNGVQKIADGEPFGNSKPSVESMFDMLDDEDEFDIEAEGAEEEPEPTPPPAKKAAAKKTAAKKAAAAPVVVEVDEGDDDLLAELGDDAENDFGDLDDLDG